jgi:hypothetical protein
LIYEVPVYYRSRENIAQASEGLKKNIAENQTLRVSKHVAFGQ